MPIIVETGKPEKDIVYWTFVENWTLEDYAKAQTWEHGYMSLNRDIPMYVIVDMTNCNVFPNDSPLGYLSENTPPNQTLSVIVTRNPLLIILISLFNLVYFTLPSIKFAFTADEALQLIEDKRQSILVRENRANDTRK